MNIMRFTVFPLVLLLTVCLGYARAAEQLRIPQDSLRIDDRRVVPAAAWVPAGTGKPTIPEPNDDRLQATTKPSSDTTSVEVITPASPPPRLLGSERSKVRTNLPKGGSSGEVDPIASELTEPKAIYLPPGVDASCPPLTLAELEEIAMAKNPTLVQAQMQVRAAEGQCVQVGLYPNPTMSYLGDEMGIGGKAGQQGASFGQEIVTTGKLAKRRAVASQEIAQAGFALQSQRCRVLNAVRTSWFEVLAAQRFVELHEKLYQIGLRGTKAAESLLAAQEVSRVDVLQAKIEAESAMVQLVNAQNRYLATWRRLAAVLGEPNMPPRLLEGNLESDVPNFEWDDVLTRLVNQSPQLAEARAGVRRAQANVTSQLADRLPNFELRGGVRYASDAQNTIGMMEVGSAIPFYNRNQGNITKAEAELVAARKEVERVELLLRQRLATVFQQYANAKQETQRYTSEIVPSATESLKLVSAGYRQGEFDYLTLLTAQRTYFRVTLEYLNAVLNYHTNAVMIDGLLLSGGLSKTDNPD